MFRSIATAVIALTLVGCSGGTSSGSSWNAMEQQDLVAEFNLRGKAKGKPGFVKQSHMFAALLKTGRSTRNTVIRRTFPQTLAPTLAWRSIIQKNLWRSR